jgi:glycosyltransferase involved in cell wall biosynthesis
VHLTWPFYYATLASIGLKNIKLVYTEHNTNNKRRNVPALRVLERFLYSRFSRIICISQGVKEALYDWVGPEIAKQMVTIQNGSRIYPLVMRPTLKGRLPRLLSIGSLTFKKNFATTIRAISFLKNEIESYYIIGEGPERSFLEHIIRTEQLEGKVKLLGWSDVIEKYLRVADIQLIPSLWEGFGLVAVEAMSTGLPVIASNVPGLREVLDESNSSIALVNQFESVDDWVVSIRKSIDVIRAKDFENISFSSRRQAEKFSLDEMADRYLALYRNLLIK